MKPANGSYRLTWGDPPHSVTYTVDDDGIHTTFGLLSWSPSAGMFIHETQDIAVECLGGGRFRAVHGPADITGTCVPVP